MFDIHIEEFYHDAFKTMHTLYQAFPEEETAKPALTIDHKKYAELIL